MQAKRFELDISKNNIHFLYAITTLILFLSRHLSYKSYLILISFSLFIH
jgi:hypothetical protein